MIIGFIVGQFAAPQLAPAQGNLEQRIESLEALLSCMTKVGDDVFFDGCNLHIRDGSGDTEGSTNGLGNLIIGYNEGKWQPRRLSQSCDWSKPYL